MFQDYFRFRQDAGDPWIESAANGSMPRDRNAIT
jgi:hypothetical protein